MNDLPSPRSRAERETATRKVRFYSPAHADEVEHIAHELQLLAIGLQTGTVRVERHDQWALALSTARLCYKLALGCLSKPMPAPSTLHPE